MTVRNPYAAPAPKRPADPLLPEVRFRRLGTSDTALVALKAWFRSAPRPAQTQIVEALAEMTDNEAVDWLAGAEIPNDTAVAVLEWVERQRDPMFSATLAVHAEEASEKPRATLIAKLQRMTG